MRKNVLECFNIGGTCRIMIYDLKNQKSRSPSVLGSKCPGSKCPWGPSVALGDIWTPDIWTPRHLDPESFHGFCGHKS